MSSKAELRQALPFKPIFVQVDGLLRRFRLRSLSYGGQVAPRKDEARRGALPAQVELFAEVVADLHDHRDAFGIAGPGDRRLVGRGTEFPAIPGPEHGDRDSVRAVGVNLELRPCHRNEFGFGLAGLVHDGSFPRTGFGSGQTRSKALLWI